MPSRTSIDDQIASLARLRADPKSDAAKAELCTALASKQNLLVAKAATIAGEARLTDLADALVAAFDRFMQLGADKACAAKTAIARALDVIEHNDEHVYMQGVRHVQLEAGWGKPTDAAAELRGICGLALARMNHRDTLWELARLLADPEPQTRLNAAQAAAHADREEGVHLLRLKVETGDDEPAVLAECLSVMLRLSPKRAIEFVGGLLDAEAEETRTMAAVALGESRRPEALVLLRARWDSDLSPSTRRMLLPAIGLHRSDAARDFLLQLLETSKGAMARDVVKAMATYRHDDAVRARIEAIVRRQDDPDLAHAFAQHFGGR